MNPLLDPGQLPLRDIHLPEAVGWWPPAIGWWIVAAAALVALVVSVRRYRAGWLHRAAAAELTAALDALRSGAEPVLCAQRLSATMRRFAMTSSERPERVAGLAGEPWLAYLDSRWERQAFTRGNGRELATAPYLGAAGFDRERCLELGRLCRAWVKVQKPRKVPRARRARTSPRTWKARTIRKVRGQRPAASAVQLSGDAAPPLPTMPGGGRG